MSYAMRVNLSIAIVAMVKRNDTLPVPAPSHLTYSRPSLISGELTGYSLRNNGSSSVCPGTIHNDTTPDDSDTTGEFYWDEVEQGIILGSFFYGYMLTQVSFRDAVSTQGFYVSLGSTSSKIFMVHFSFLEELYHKNSEGNGH